MKSEAVFPKALNFPAEGSADAAGYLESLYKNETVP